MKQFVASLFPDKAVAWKLTAMVLLILLAAVFIFNTAVPFAVALFSVEKPADVMVSDQAAEPQHLDDSKLQQTIAALEQQEADANNTISTLEAQIAQDEALIAELQAKGAADAEEIANLKQQIDLQSKQIEQVTQERDEASQALEMLREQLSRDYTVVFKLTRCNLFGAVADTLTYYHHVSAEEYATYHIGDVVENITGLDFPVGNGWSAEVSNMMVNLVDV